MLLSRKPQLALSTERGIFIRQFAQLIIHFKSNFAAESHVLFRLWQLLNSAKFDH